MKNRLLLLYILILTLILSGCGAASSSGNSSDLGYETEEEEDTTVTLPSPIDNIPTPDSYEREKVRFSDVEYVRPDTQALLDMITSLKDAMSWSICCRSKRTHACRTTHISVRTCCFR